MESFRISVVIPNYNYGRFLGSAIESALCQDHPPAEVIVVDDGSTDDSRAVAASFGSRVRWLEQPNQGVSAARNRGIEHSIGNWIAFLDADDTWHPSKLAKQVSRLAALPESAMVHCAIRLMTADGAEAGFQSGGMEGPELAGEFLLLQRPVVVAGSTLVVARAALESCGLFDSRLSSGEDWEFCHRIAVRHPIAYVPEPLVNYRIHGSNMHFNIKAMERNMLLVFGESFADSRWPRTFKSAAYANLHMILAGSYFHNRDYFQASRHIIRSLAWKPSKLSYVLAYPSRQFARWRSRSSAGSPNAIV
jgi:glycosyltransferase involved in cell wall biosynthesis